jgi:hypothetical protein
MNKGHSEKSGWPFPFAHEISATPVTLDTRDPGDVHASIVSLCFLRIVVTVSPFTRALRF